ncbi:hypothetical protein FOPG_19515 [Fusarium oxysporum f. sp. conglutinans race 2 54008]|uniref:Uncharacterized protein n=1 Tax=Fusarium oxysporum f. sp. conglutinans race 2 54008 TaxID=1089457 RepID=X0GWC5_FUSOX|nr:hypothetical protein FOPG_19515 [Fusarium oxysporum f. sp. conglutinans race 2 54008]
MGKTTGRMVVDVSVAAINVSAGWELMWRGIPSEPRYPMSAFGGRRLPFIDFKKKTLWRLAIQSQRNEAKDDIYTPELPESDTSALSKQFSVANDAQSNQAR